MISKFYLNSHVHALSSSPPPPPLPSKPVSQPLNTMSHITSKLLGFQSPCELIVFLQSIYALPAKNSNTCWNWESFNLLLATGCPLSTWFPKGSSVAGAAAVTKTSFEQDHYSQVIVTYAETTEL